MTEVSQLQKVVRITVLIYYYNIPRIVCVSSPIRWPLSLIRFWFENLRQGDRFNRYEWSEIIGTDPQERE